MLCRRLIDNKSLALIRYDAAADGTKAHKILKEHYSGKSELWIINLYTSLTKIRMADNESVTDYIIRAENTITALIDARETMIHGLVIAMILGELPDSFKPLVVHVTQNEDNIMFTVFKRRIQVFEKAEKMKETKSTDDVMKICAKERIPTKCGVQGHKAKKCH